MKNTDFLKRIKSTITTILALCITFAPSSLFFGVEADAAGGKWISTWATSLVNGSIELGDIVPGFSVQDVIPSKSTIRTELSVTAGGEKLKFQLSNQFGKSAITINEASVARTDESGKAKIVDGTQTPITFDGNADVTIQPGDTIWSDAIDFKTEVLEKISISMHFKNLTYITSTGLSNGSTYLATGLLMNSQSSSKVDYVSLPTSNEIKITSGTVTYHTIPFLSGINTFSTEENACTAVFIGDSTLVNDTYLHYAQRIVSGGTTNVGIINEAVIGNKLLSDGSGLIGNLCGKAMIDRFTRDVLEQAGVKYCFVKIGLNDIAHQYSKSLSASTPKYSPQDIISGYKTLVNLCHNKGIKIYFFTKSPWKGYEREFLGQSGDLTWSEDIQKLCDELTEWVKTNSDADGCIDCADLADPSNPYALCPTFTPDGAHLTDLGSIALADLIPVEYVGADKSKCKTAASLTGTDPYKEKKQIIAKMNANKSNESSTKSSDTDTTANSDKNAATIPAEENTTAAKKEDVTTTTPAPTTQPSTQSEQTTVAVTEPATSPIFTVPAYEEPTTVQITPVDGKKIDTGNSGGKSTPAYNVIDIESIGTDGGSIVFILVLISSIVVTGLVVILTANKKREEEI